MTSQTSIAESQQIAEQSAPVVSGPEWQQKTPSEWAAADGSSYDCTCWIGPLWPEMAVNNPAPWPMYSFERPSTVLWNAIAARLNQRGWTDAEIKNWLQSKGPRWALDGALGDALEAVGVLFAESIASEVQP